MKKNAKQRIRISENSQNAYFFAFKVQMHCHIFTLISGQPLHTNRHMLELSYYMADVVDDGGLCNRLRLRNSRWPLPRVCRGDR